MPTDHPFDKPQFFVFRAALLPFDDLLAWSEGLEAPGAVDDPARLEQALHADRKRLRERLHTIVTTPEIREALFLASPDLDAALERWLENPEGKKALRLERTLVRYFSRMCGRSTPFGLFAGYSLGNVDGRTRLQVEARTRYRRHARLDMDYLFALIDTLAKDPQLQDELRYRPNSSLYRTAGRLRYFESRLQDGMRSYQLVAVEETDYLTATLQGAARGATIAELAQPLVDDEVTIDDATGYVRELVVSQMLVPDLAPKATGPEPIHGLIAQLRQHPVTQAAAERLDDVRRTLERFEALPPGIDVREYRAIAAKLEELPAKVELSRLLQVDMVKPAGGATLGDDVIEEIARGLRLMRGLRPEPAEDEFAKFREAFRARYENREMPLFEVLDEESGIGFGSAQGLRAETVPLLQGLALPQGRAGDDRVRWSSFDSFLLEKLDDVARAGSMVMTFQQEELERFARNPWPIPDSVSAMVKVAARSQEALDAGDFQVVIGAASGPSGANLLGRFCHGDPALIDYTERHLRAEEALQPDAIFAEIVHLPEGRTGNVILRPTLREYEIPFLGRSAVAEEFQIPVSDLMLSVVGQSVVLTSRRLGKRIIPRLTTAHNYRRGLGIYRFLCSLQQQSGRYVGWSWGSLDGLRFQPRVVVGRLVLSPARWRVDRRELQDAIDARDGRRYALVQQWRAGRRIPRFILLADGDNTLPFDLDNALSVETMVALVKKRGEFRLHELCPAPEELGAFGPEGRFVHEVVVPMIMKREPASATATAAPPVPPPRNAEVPLGRTFPPGSEWLFAKLYTGNAGCDQLLQDVVAPLARQALGDGSADRWFFIRYGDPDWHLRLRVHGDPRRLAAEVLPRLHALAAPLLSNGLLWKIELGTYEREIERYGGGEAMLLAERLFRADSDAAVAILAELSGEAVADLRWRVALRGVDQLLDDLGFDLQGKIDVLSSARRGLLGAMNASPGLDHQLGDRFRKERKSLESLLDRANDAGSPSASALAALDRRSAALRPVAASLRQLDGAGRLSSPLPALAGSYTHMHTNRMLRGAGKQQETVIYDFLVRLYESQRARAGRRQ